MFCKRMNQFHSPSKQTFFAATKIPVIHGKPYSIGKQLRRFQLNPTTQQSNSQKPFSYSEKNSNNLHSRGLSRTIFSELTENLRRRHDLPTPESPMSKSLNRQSLQNIATRNSILGIKWVPEYKTCAYSIPSIIPNVLLYFLSFIHPTKDNLNFWRNGSPA